MVKKVQNGLIIAPMVQCVACWHRWQVKSAFITELCPLCGSWWQVRVSLILSSLGGKRA